MAEDTTTQETSQGLSGEQQEPQTKRVESMRKVAVLMPIIIAVLVIVYAVAAWFLLFKPKIGPLMKGGEYDFTQFNERIASDEEYIQTVKDSLSEYRKIEPRNREKVGNIIPEAIMFPSIMAQLESLAENNSMQLTSVEALMSELTMPVNGLVPVRVTATFDAGTYQDFKSLLGDVQNSERLFDVQEFSYSPDMTSYMLIMRAYVLGKN